MLTIKHRERISLGMKRAYKSGIKQSSTKGKTYIEVYGEDKAKEINKKKSINGQHKHNMTNEGSLAIRNSSIERFKGKDTWNKGKTGIYSEESLYNMGSSLRGKTYEERYGDKAIKVKKKIRKNTSLALGGTGVRSEEGYPREFSPELKQRIIKRDNYECQNEDCRMTQEEHENKYGRNLEIHHIDHNIKNCKEENLITACKQCNILANMERAYWEDYYKQKIKIKGVITCVQ